MLILFKNISDIEEKIFSSKISKDLKIALGVGICITIISSISIFDFSNKTFSNVDSPVTGEEVVEGVYKFDFPFLADKLVWEKTINAFKKSHPELKINFKEFQSRFGQ